MRARPDLAHSSWITTRHRLRFKETARTGPHFAALVFSTIHIPGDERSRTNPGHGYPAENKPVAEYIAFDSRDEMERWVSQQETKASQYSLKDYQVIEVKPLAVEVKASVSIG